MVLSKHQSAWETIILSWLLHAPAFVLKVELLRLPIIGLFFTKTGCIPVDRSDGMRALRKMREAALELAAQGRSMLIFPQVTRIAPGASNSSATQDAGRNLSWSMAAVCDVLVSGL